MKKIQIKPDTARSFLMAVAREWDRQGLLIHLIKVKRDKDDHVSEVLMTYEDRQQQPITPVNDE